MGTGAWDFTRCCMCGVRCGAPRCDSERCRADKAAADRRIEQQRCRHAGSLHVGFDGNPWCDRCGKVWR